MKKRTKIIVGILVIIALAVAGYFYWRGGESTIIEAETITTKKGEITTMITATGTIEPINQVDVGTQVSGTIEKIYVDYNSEVKQGQILAELDKTNLTAALTQAQAAYDNALSQKNYAQTVYARQKTLYDNQVISKSDYDDALYSLQTAKGTVTQRLSDLQSARTNLGYANIYSPINGVVLSKDIEEGQTVAASYSTPTLFTIAQNLEEMQVEADVDEADIGSVEVGQRVEFTVDAYVGETFNGEVTQVRLNPTETSNVVTYTVIIKADNKDLKLKPGLTATVSIYTMELNDVLTTQSKALNFSPDVEMLNQYNQQHGLPSNSDQNTNAEHTVWVLGEGKSIKPKTVSIGASDGVNVQILSGVEEGEELVYSLKNVSAAKGPASGDNESPFMPKRPR
ncbi:MAG: efflux RND transporter periplasmic adaptor subunit [Weeksellaceae bacterium]